MIKERVMVGTAQGRLGPGSQYAKDLSICSTLPRTDVELRPEWLLVSRQKTSVQHEIARSVCGIEQRRLLMPKQEVMTMRV